MSTLKNDVALLIKGTFWNPELIFQEIFLSYARIALFLFFYNRSASCNICQLVKHTVEIPSFYSKYVLGKYLCAGRDDEDESDYHVIILGPGKKMKNNKEFIFKE